MKPIIYISIFFFAVLNANSQLIHIYDLNTEDYPRVNAKFLAIDYDGQQIFPSVDDLVLKENGSFLDDFDLSCPPLISKKPLSAVLSIDMSGSMLDSNGRNWDLAQEALEAWSDNMTPDIETSVNGFNFMNFLLTDFTDDPQEIRNSLENILPFGGTNFDVAFLDSLGGSIALSQRAIHPEPIIVLLSDGEASVRERFVIEKANELGVRIFAVILNQECPDVIKEICNSTRGFYFDQLSTKAEINEAYSSILNLTVLESNCMISWTSSACETNKIGNLELIGAERRAPFEYSTADSLLPSFSYFPDRYFIFNEVTLGNSGTEWVTITARNSNIEIDSVIVDNENYSVVDLGGREFPFTLETDEEWSLQIRFDYTEEEFEFATFEIISNSCSDINFFAAGGDQGVIPSNNALRIIEPNGGEIYFGGIDTTIRWTGSASTDSILVELSTNEGQNWDLLSKSATNFNLDYKTPTSISQEYLIRLTRFSNDFGKEYLSINTDSINVNDVDWQPEGTNVAVANKDEIIRIYNSTNGQTFTYLEGHSSEVNAISWSPDAVRLTSVSNDSTLVIWNYFARVPIVSKNLGERAFDVEWSPDGKYIAYGGQNNNIEIINPTNGNSLETLSGHTQDILTISWSEDASLIASAGRDSTIRIYRTDNWSLVNSFKAYRAPVSEIDWLDNERIVSVSLQNETNEVVVWPLNPGLFPTRIPVIEQLRAVQSFISDDKELISYAGESGRVYVYDLIAKEEIFVFYEDIWVQNALAWSPDGNRLSVGLNGANSAETVRFFSIDNFPIMQATSDSTFSITRLDISAQNIDMGNVPLGKSVNLKIDEFIRNNSLLTADITSVYLTNNNSNHFSADVDIQTSLESGSFTSGEFSYSPKYTGNHFANITINVSGKPFIYRITGSCFEPNIRDTTLNFGQLLVGDQITETIEIFNNSQNEIEIFSSELIGPDLENFQLLQSPNRIATNSSELFIVRYNPNFEGLQNSSIEINYEGDGSPAIFRFFGEGIKPELNSYDIEDLTVKCLQTDTLSFFVTNSGSGNLIIDSLVNSNNKFINQNIDFPFILTKTDSLEIKYLFTPELDSNLELDTVIIYSNNITGLGNVPIGARVNYSNLDFINGNEILFEQSEKNKVESSSLEILNSGEFEINLSAEVGKTSSDNKFTIISIEPELILPGESAIITIEFAGGDYEQNYSHEFILSDQCERSYPIITNASISGMITGIELLSSNELSIDCGKIDTIQIELINGNILDEIINIYSDNYSVSTSIQSLNINQRFFVEIIIESNEQNPIINDQITIETQSDNSPFIFPITVITNIEELEIQEDYVEFIIDNPIGPFTSSFTIDNNDENVKVWTPPYTFGDYTITDIIPRITPVGGSSIARVYYYAIDTDTSVINLPTLCETDQIEFRTFAEFYPEFNLVVTDQDVNISDVFSLNIQVENERNLFDNYDGLIVSINYNPTLLRYLNIPENEIISDGRAYLDLQLLNSDYDDAWTNHTFKVLWGNDSVSTVVIDSVSLINSEDPKFYSTQDGLIRILDLCEAGGTRLFKGGFFDFQISPNPASDLINIEIEILESASHKLEIINYNGKIIRKVFDGISEPGRYNFETNLQDIPSGIYFFRLTTPSKIYVERIVIE